MINKVICSLETGDIRGFNRQHFPNEYVLEFEGDLCSISKYDPIRDMGVNLKQDFSLFNATDILKAKGKQLEEKTGKEHYMFDMFLDYLRLDYSDIKADTGVALLSLIPKGYAKTQKIKLEAPTKEIEIYERNFNIKNVDMFINDVKVTSTKKVTFEKEVEEIVIKFVNNKSKRQRLKNYTLLY